MSVSGVSRKVSFRTIRIPFTAFLLYFAVTLVLCAPVLNRLTTHCLGRPDGELSMQLWNEWWASEHLLRHGAFPTRTSLINAPDGGTLFPADPLNTALFLPIYRNRGPAARYNWSLILNLTFGAFSMFCLAFFLIGHLPASLVAGAVYGYCPYILSYAVESGAVDSASVGWLPLFVLFLLKTVKEKSLFNPAGAAVAFFLASFACPYYGEFALILAALFGLYALLFVRDAADLVLEPPPGGGAPVHAVTWRDRALAGRVLAGLLLCGLLMLPYVRAMRSTIDTPLSIIPRETLVTDSFRNLENLNPLTGKYTRCAVLVDLIRWGKDADRLRGAESRLTGTTYCGFLVLALGCAALARPRKLVVFLGACALFMLLLSLGPYLQITDRLFLAGPHNPAYALMYRCFPLFSKLLEPFRLTLLFMLFLAPLAGWGLLNLVRAFPRRGAIPCLLVLALVLQDFLFLSPAPLPLSVTGLEKPAWCGALRADPRPYGIIDLPFSYRRGELFFKKAFYYQTLHGRAIPNRVAFMPALREKSALYRALLDLEYTSFFELDDPTATASLGQLRAWGFGAFIVHTELYESARLAAVRAVLARLAGPPEDMGDGVEKYAIP